MARVRGVLEGMPETEQVEFIPEEESFVVKYGGKRLLGPEFSRRVMSAVIMPGARKLLDDIGKTMHRNN
ncbi:hypothetical protein [Thermincola ferriacetica]